jgi:DNA-binding MarR family transcriptional regulator
MAHPRSPSPSAPAVAEAAMAELESQGCIGMRLRQAMRQATQILDAGLKPAGIAITQFAPMAFLYKDGPQSMGELAEKVGADPTTLTRILRPLERRGLLSQEVSPTDRRRRVIRLTPQGRRAFQIALPLWQKAQAEISRRVGNTEIRALRAQLDHTIARL